MEEEKQLRAINAVTSTDVLPTTTGPKTRMAHPLPGFVSDPAGVPVGGMMIGARPPPLDVK